MSKEEIISKIYNDIAGFGSIINTYKEAHAKDNSITLNDVKEWFKNNFQRNTQLRGYNSFVAHYFGHEFQMDLFFINEGENQKFTIAMIMIDAFSKYIAVVPIKSKAEGDTLAGMIECFAKMRKKPEILYTDDERAFSSKYFNEYYKDNNIEHIVTRTSVPIADRAIRTIKSMIYKRWKDKTKPWYDETFVSSRAWFIIIN
jgi:hypothetical protein